MRTPTASAVVLSLLLFAGIAGAAPSGQPSDRGCLVAWNAPSNHLNRARLIALRPVTALALRAGKSFTDTWTKKTSTSTSTDACALTVARADTIRIVTGRWSFGRVDRWSWGRAFATTNVFGANVRLLSDGRVTKIYSH